MFGYRTKNWFPLLDEVNLAFRLIAGKILEIRLFRELNRGGFSRDAVSRLSDVLPVIESALQMRSIYQLKTDCAAHQTVQHISLTQRQLEVFRWWAAGKTLEDIGMILGIKRRTVRYHMEKARELYGYSTVQQTAIRIAQDYRLDPLTGSLAGNEPSKHLPSELKL